TEGVSTDTNIMTWEELAQVQASGLVDIEGHTVSHPHLTDLTDAQVTAELTVSKQALESHLGKEIRLLAYPFGDYDDRIERIAWQSGYAGSVKAFGGVEPTAVDPWAINRI